MSEPQFPPELQAIDDYKFQSQISHNHIERLSSESDIEHHWPTKTHTFKSKTPKKSKEEPKKYYYENDRVFQTALKYFNCRWKKPVKKNKKVIKAEKQEIYIEKLSMNIKQGNYHCNRCEDELSGAKYFVNENKPSQVLCFGCLGRKLKKEVGIDEERILDELQWLNEKDLLPEHMVDPKIQWSFQK